MASSATARLSPTIRSSRSTRWTGMTSPKSPPGGSPATPCRVMAACGSGAPTDPANWFRQLRGPLSYAPSPTASKRLSFHIHRRQQRWLRRRGDGRDHARTGNAGTVDRWNGTAGGVSQAALSLGSRSDRIWRSSFPTTRTFFNTSDLTTLLSERVLICRQTLPPSNLGSDTPGWKRPVGGAINPTISGTRKLGVMAPVSRAWPSSALLVAECYFLFRLRFTCHPRFLTI